MPALQVRNYYQPVLRGVRGGGSNQPYIRALLPFEGFGGRNLMRISLPAGTMVWDKQGTFSAHDPWGLLAGLVGYRQSPGGKANALTVQPFIFRNIGKGFYRRSSAISTLDVSNGTGVLPIGLGLGKVTRLGRGHLLNTYVEPQVSVVANGEGQPRFQVFAGFNLPFLPR